MELGGTSSNAKTLQWLAKAKGLLCGLSWQRWDQEHEKEKDQKNGRNK